MTTARITGVVEKTSKKGDKYTSVQVEIDGKTRSLWLSQKFKDHAKLVNGTTVEMEIYEGKTAGYINSIGNVVSTPVQEAVRPTQSPKTDPMPPQEVSKSAYDSKGLEKGNYRTNLTNFLIARWDKNVNIEDVENFNRLLKLGEDDFLAVQIDKHEDIF